MDIVKKNGRLEDTKSEYTSYLLPGEIRHFETCDSILGSEIMNQ
jgi:hypothetical protein